MRFLSDEWIEAMNSAVEAEPTLRSAGNERSIVIQQTVTGSNDGNCEYHIDLGKGAAAVRDGTAADPTVTFSATYDVPADIAQGKRSAQEAFMQGDLKIGGDIAGLVDTHNVFKGLADVFAEVRADTEF